MNAPPRSSRRKRNLKRFDEDNVLTLPVKRRQHMAWDTGTDAARGLGILISPTGTRSYRVVYYFPGSSKPHTMHLGRVGELSLAEARKRAMAARKTSREGTDPKADNLTKSSDFKSAVEDYVRHEQIGRRGNATARECQRIILKACAEWHHRPVATIRLQEIDQLLNSIRDGDGEGTKPRRSLANKVYGLLRTFFAWCAKPTVSKVKISPMIGLDKPVTKEQRRNKRYSYQDEEIKTVWRAANKIGVTEGQFLKMLLLTGKRKGALGRMRWEEINNSWFWEPPQSEHKNKRLHPIPLSSLAQRVLGPRQAAGYVFPGPVERTHYIDAGILHGKVRRESGIEDFFPHALRHTAETQMAKLGIPPHIRDLLFDHRSARGAGSGYDHHSYGNEMRDAMETWAKYIAKLVQPKDVTTTQRRTANATMTSD